MNKNKNKIKKEHTSYRKQNTYNFYGNVRTKWNIILDLCGGNIFSSSFCWSTSWMISDENNYLINDKIDDQQ